MAMSFWMPASFVKLTFASLVEVIAAGVIPCFNMV